MTLTASYLLSGLILLGAAIMLVNIIRFRETMRMVNRIESSGKRRLRFLGTVHQVLMLFFLLGYLAVAVAFVTRAAFVSEIFVGLIFFLGAIFVWLGILLQHLMITMIQRRYDQANQANAALEQTNRQLTLEMAERERVQQALRESEQRISRILDYLPAGVLVVDEETHVVREANPAALTMMDLSHGEVVGTDCRGFIEPMVRDQGQNGDPPPWETGKPRRVWLNAADTRIPVLHTVCRIQLEDRNHLLQSFIDLSDKERLETQLRQAQKMEALGTMAGSVAHDLNNILSGIVSYPEMLLAKLDQDSPLRRPLQTMKKSGDKAATIVRDMLTLARRGVEIKEVIHPGHIIHDYLDSPEHDDLRRRHPLVTITFEIEDDLHHIVGSAVQLSKTIMNLVRNGAEAMPEGGRLHLKVENRYVDQTFDGYDHVEAGDYAVIALSDTGVGIADEDRDRIFEPFYTTKQMGQSGTGLGMAVVWGTVRDHMGHIEIDSAPGQGTTFTLYLPATRNQAPAHAPSPSMEAFKGKGALVLVVDDVAVQREIAMGVLELLDYDAHCVSSGEDALAWFETNTADLVILDMIMAPGISGLETYEQILKRHPEQRAILVSGYSETRDVQQCLDLGASTYVRKPYHMQTLAAAVHEALNDDRKVSAAPFD